MHRILAGMAAGVLLAGLALAGEPVDWSKAFEKRKDDFDWSRVTNRTTATPGGPVDWSKAFAKPGQAQAAPPSPAAPGDPVPLAQPRAAAKLSLPEESLNEPAPAKPGVPAKTPVKPASPPAPPAPTPDFAPPAPIPAPQPVPPVEPTPPAVQAAPPAPALQGASGSPSDMAASPVRPVSPAPSVATAPPGKAAEDKGASLQTPPPASKQVQPDAPSPAPVPEPAQVHARPEPEPARPAAKKTQAPRQVAAVEPPGPLFPKKEYDDGQVAHFLAVALPAPDGAAAGQARPMILTRWQGDVRLRVSGRNTAGAEAQVRAAAEEVAAALAGQGRITLREAEPANLLVYVLPSGPGDSPGYVQNAYDVAAITGSKVVIYADKTGRSSVLRLLLAALGLPGPAPAGQDSVLAASAPAGAGLTALDRTALDLLYNPVLSPGMDQASARQAAHSLR